MRNLVFILFAITAIPVFCQELTTWDVDSIGTLAANELLKADRANEVLILSSGCVGCEVIDDSCSCLDGYSITYLIWKENAKIWLTHVNCCADTETTELKDSGLWEELTLNKNRIFSSKFKEDYVTIHNGFWYLKVLPTFPNELQIYDYYFEEGHKFHIENKSQYAREFLKIIQKAIIENGE